MGRQGRFAREAMMRREEREELELEKLVVETNKLTAEQYKLISERSKISRETRLYPVFVSATVVLAATALVRLLIEHN
jgi:hypothetical protein